MRSTWLAVSALLLATTATHADPAGKPLPEKVQAFLADHCVVCHGERAPKAGLRLDHVTADFTTTDGMLHWTKVFDKVTSGDMPPRARQRPPEDERRAATGWLHAQLDAQSRAQQQANGRVGLRRLNRVEYENSLHDLLGVQVPIQDLLPDDGSMDGFDNVAAALDVSPAHLARYLQAADRVLNVALAPRKSQNIAQKVIAGADAERYKTSLDRDILRDGDALVFFSSRQGHMRRSGALAVIPGQYRLRLHVAAVNTDRPVTLAVHHKPITHFLPDRIPMYFDVQPGEAKTYEYTGFLDRGESFSWNAPKLPTEEAFKKLKGETPLAELKAPGFRLEWFEFEGPLGDAWPPRSHRLLFGDQTLLPASHLTAIRAGRKPDKKEPQAQEPWEAHSEQPREDASRLLTAFARRAFRRTVSDADLQPYTAMVLDRLDRGYPFAEAMRVGLKAILCSPRFLFLSEQPGALDDFAVASRLSYFLWSTTPDDELLDLAEKGRLREPAVRRAQVERLLNDPRSAAFAANFVGQWLDLRKLDATNPEGGLYPEFDETLRWSMAQETHGFFNEILKHDRSLLDFIHSDFLILNERLAKHYGIPGVEGMTLRKVANPAGSKRGGVLTQASVLKVTANGTTTSPVVRGKFVLERIIGKPPTPPPPDIPGVEPDIRGATTIRQQLAKHREVGACASCHIQIDPPGFALENFDVIGGWRTHYRAAAQTKAGRIELDNGRKVWKGPAVEAGDVLPDGRPFRDIDEYKQFLLEDPDQLARNLAEKLLIYATGAGIQYADRAALDEMVTQVRDKNYGFRALIHAVAQNRVFLHK